MNGAGTPLGSHRAGNIGFVASSACFMYPVLDEMFRIGGVYFKCDFSFSLPLGQQNQSSGWEEVPGERLHYNDFPLCSPTRADISGPDEARGIFQL